MVGMVEGLLTTIQKRIGDVAYRSHLFNLYLVVEFYVGRHEHDIICRWAREHPDTTLIALVSLLPPYGDGTMI